MAAPGAAAGGAMDELTVRLQMDAAQYMKTMADSVKETNQAAQNIQQAAVRIEGYQKSVESFGKTALESLTALGALKLYHDAFEASEKREQSMRRLNAILEVNGRNVRATTKDYMEFSKQMKEQTLLTAGEVLQLLKLAETYQLTGEAAKKAVREANAIAAAAEVDATTAMRLVAQMNKGNTENAMHMARMIPALRGIRDEAEFVAQYQKLVASGLKVVAGDAADTSGRLEKLGRTFKGLVTDIGDFIQRGLEPVVEFFEKWKASYDKMSPGLREFIVQVGASAAGFAALVSALYLGGKALSVFAGAVVAILSPVNIAVAAVMAFAYGLVKVVEGIRDVIAEGGNVPRVTKMGLDLLPGGGGKVADELKGRYGKEAGKWFRDIVEEAWNKAAENVGSEFGRELIDKLFGDVEAHEANKVTEMIEDAARAMRKAFEKGVAIAEVNEDLERSIINWGKTAEEVKLYDLRMKGATEAELEHTKAMIEHKRWLDENKRAFAEAESAIQDNLTPLEKYNQEIFRLGQLVLRNALSWDVYTRAVQKAQMALDQAFPAITAKEFGSTEAITSIQQHFEPYGGRESPVEALNRVKVAVDAVEKGVVLINRTLEFIFVQGQ